MKKNKLKKDGKAPVYLRITVEGNRFENSTHRNVDPDNWDAGHQRVKGRSESARVINTYLTELENEVLRYFNKLLEKEDSITIDDFKRKFKEGKQSDYTFCRYLKKTTG